MLCVANTQSCFREIKLFNKRLTYDQHRHSQSSKPRASSLVKGRPMFSPDNTERSGPGAPRSGAASPK
jgi:hypothetical protein